MEDEERLGQRERVGKAATAYRTISEVSDEIDVPAHVLRFWETKFSTIRPMKRGGGRRYYRPEDVAALQRIRALLYDQGYTIRGVQKLLRDGRGRLPDDGESLDRTSTAASEATPGESTGSGGGSMRELEAILRELKDLRSTLSQRLAQH